MVKVHHNKGNLNPDFHIKKKKKKDISYYTEGLKSKNRFVLSECITLLESQNQQKRITGLHILEHLPVPEKPTIRIGITGSPGVGKSTFIESFGLYLLSKGHHIAILAIDPSSQLNKGSILGDKTRMINLAAQPDVYIRPTPAGNLLGGIAAYTKDTISICESAGYDVIIVETVGVGQSETEVDTITDINMLLLQPGAGDDMQGIKRGVVENADVFIINKADGDQLKLAKNTLVSYQQAIRLFHHEVKGWNSPVLLCSSLEHKGMDTIYDTIFAFVRLLYEENVFESRRKGQEQQWFEKQASKMLQQIVFGHSEIKAAYTQLSQEIKNNKLSITAALEQMKQTFLAVFKD